MGSLKHEIETPHRINPGGHGRHGKVCRTLAASHPATRAWGGKEAGPGRNACDAVTLLDAVYDWYLQNPPVTPAHNFCCLKCNHKLRCFYKNCRFKGKALALSPIRKHTYKKTRQGLRWILCMEDSSFDRRPFPGETQVLHHKYNCFPVFQEAHWWKLTICSGKYQIIQEHQSSSKNYTCKTMALDATLKVSNLKLHVLSTQFSTLFYVVSTGFYTVFVPAVFLKNTHLGALDDLHHCWRRNMSTQSFIEGCVCDLTKRFPHHGIYLIHNCIFSNRVRSLWTPRIAVKPLLPLSVTLFRQIHLITLFPGTKVHEYQKTIERKIIVVCSKKQKFLKQQKSHTIGFSGILYVMCTDLPVMKCPNIQTCGYDMMMRF